MALVKKYDDKLNVWDVDLSGEIDIYNAETFKEELSELELNKNVSINIDCKDLKYIDSTGLGVLVSVLNKVKSFDGKITLFNLKPHLAKIFQLTGLTKIMEIEVDEN